MNHGDHHQNNHTWMPAEFKSVDNGDDEKKDEVKEVKSVGGWWSVGSGVPVVGAAPTGSLYGGFGFGGAPAVATSSSTTSSMSAWPSAAAPVDAVPSWNWPTTTQTTHTQSTPSIPPPVHFPLPSTSTASTATPEKPTFSGFGFPTPKAEEKKVQTPSKPVSFPSLDINKPVPEKSDFKPFVAEQAKSSFFEAKSTKLDDHKAVEKPFEHKPVAEKTADRTVVEQYLKVETPKQARKPSIDDSWVKIEHDEIKEQKKLPETPKVAHQAPKPFGFTPVKHESTPGKALETPKTVPKVETPKTAAKVEAHTPKAAPKVETPTVEKIAQASVHKIETPKVEKIVEKVWTPKVENKAPEVTKVETPKVVVKKEAAAPKVVKKEVSKAAEGTRRTSGRARHAPATDIVIEAAASKKAATTEIIGAGPGQKFAEIPHISAFLAKKKTSDKTVLLAHRLIFGRPGEALKRKANLRQFNGFPVETNGKGAMEKKLVTQTIPALRDLAIMFNLERSGEKGAMATRIAEFLEKPKDFGKSRSVAVTSKKAVAKKGAKKAATSAKKAVTGKGKGTKRKAESELTPDTVETDDDFEEEIASLKNAGE